MSKKIYAISHEYNPNGYVRARRVAGVYKNKKKLEKFFRKEGFQQSPTDKDYWLAPNNSNTSFEAYFIDTLTLEDLGSLIDIEFNNKVNLTGLQIKKDIENKEDNILENLKKEKVH